MLITDQGTHFENPNGFIVFEGVNGAGKSTLLSKVAEYLQEQKQEVVLTREPGATALGKSIRKLLMNSDSGSISPLAELFLFSADRNQHVETLIKPALNLGKRVLADRYFYSTIAFQGYGRELDIGSVQDICRYAVQGLYPDLVILLDLDPVIGLERARLRSGSSQKSERDAFEEEELGFHRRLREGFLKIADQSAQKFLVIDASQSAARIFEMCKPAIDCWLEDLYASG